ncbi:MAG: C25 family cysteine peptidase [Planctomycetota bacterium]
MIQRLTALALLLGSVTTAQSAERSLSDFEDYARTKLPGLSDAQLKSFAKAVDTDGDGKISDEEFAARSKALRSLRQRPAPAKKNAETTDTKGEARQKTQPVSVPFPASVKPELLLITHESTANAWLPFAEWKTQHGKPTKIVTVGQIAAKYQAKSIQEKIRLCVREHIERDEIRWVLLGGDCLPGDRPAEEQGLVPGGHITVHAQEPKGIPTDIVYLSPTTGDADADVIIGEWKDDRDAIVYPDGTVGLGRVPVRTAADIAAFTEKVIAYESKYPTTDFAQKMVYTCTEKHAYPKVLQSWDGFLSKSWKDGSVQRFFSHQTPWDAEGKPGSYDLSPKNFVKLINEGSTGKLHIHGHGHLPSWVLEGSQFGAKQVAKLSNAGAYPLITTVSCNTGEYDSATDPSIVERMIRKPKGGSVAIVAPIRTGKPHFAKRSDFRLMITEGKLDGTTQTMTRYWVNGLKGSGRTTGEALMKAKAQMADDAKMSPNYHLCISEINLLGDPTLDMRARAAKDLRVQAPKSISTGKQDIEISTGVAFASVCVWKGEELYTIGDADGEGKASIQVDVKTPGTMTLGVYGKSLNSVTTTIEVR